MTDLIPRDAVRNEVAKLGQEFLSGGSPTAATVLNLAVDRINAIPAIDPAAIREAALREALTACVMHGQKSKTAMAISAALLALIGEKK